MIGLLVDRILDTVAASPAKPEMAPMAAQIERLDSISGCATIDNVVAALTGLADLLTRSEVAAEEKTATQ